MCGIAGFYLKNSFNEKENVLKLMNDKLSHRGPDGEGFFIDNNVSFSHKRLAIIDLNERSNQPYISKDKNYIITFNGEIYNYLELKKILIQDGFSFLTTSDTEVLLNSYIRWGEEMLQKIKGMFAFSIYDKKKNIIFCARDHFGQKPFFYYHLNGNFIFSSELTSLMVHPIIKKELCIRSIGNYLHYDSFAGSTTPLKNCYKLLPSQYMVFNINDQSLNKKNYWNVQIENEKINHDDYYDRFIDKLTQSTKRHLRSDVPIGLYLSGGVDSSTLACLSRGVLKNDNIDAFNLKFKNKTFNENTLAHDTAKKLNLKLTTYNLEDMDFISEINKTVNNMDEPLADLGFIAISFISNFVSKENYKVVISGDGGDELLMGYEPFQKYWLFNILNSSKFLSKFVKFISGAVPDNYDYMGLTHKMKIFSRALGHPKLYSNTRWISSFMPEEIKKLVVKNDKDEDGETLSEKEIYSYIFKLINSIKSKNEYDQLSIQYQKHFLSNIICNHTDKANMQYSIEARSPFLDPELFNFANSLNQNLKLKGGYSKIILRKYLKENLKNATYKNPKKGFTVPMAQWINNELREVIFDTLNKSTVEKTGFLNHDYLVDNVINPHVKKHENNHKKIWNIFILINWFKNNNLL